jgi:YHS domain-containing protein
MNDETYHTVGHISTRFLTEKSNNVKQTKDVQRYGEKRHFFSTSNLIPFKQNTKNVYVIRFQKHHNVYRDQTHHNVGHLSTRFLGQKSNTVKRTKYRRRYGGKRHFFSTSNLIPFKQNTKNVYVIRFQKYHNVYRDQTHHNVGHLSTRFLARKSNIVKWTKYRRRYGGKRQFLI